MTRVASTAHVGLRALENGTELPGIDRVAIWLNDPGNWQGPDGLLSRLSEHLAYTTVVAAIAITVALPLGAWVGHTGKGAQAVAGAVNAMRAVPSLGLLTLLVVQIAPRIDITSGAGRFVPPGSVPYFIPVLIVLVILAVPQVLTNTYAGISNVDRAVIDAARGTGMTELQVILKVEIPCALPLILQGIRSATLQVIASLTVAAYAPLVGGLGRIIVDGDTQLTNVRYGYPAMVAAGLVVAVLAILTDVALGGLQRLAVSPGVSGKHARRPSAAAAISPDPESPQSTTSAA